MNINPCVHCREAPSSGYYAGDFSVECESCLTSVSRHFIDFPHLSFEVTAELTKNAAIRIWNRDNPNTKGPQRGTQFEAQ